MEDQSKCKHKVIDRQAVNISEGKYTHASYLVVCLNCGKELFKKRIA